MSCARHPKPFHLIICNDDRQDARHLPHIQQAPSRASGKNLGNCCSSSRCFRYPFFSLHFYDPSSLSCWPLENTIYVPTLSRQKLAVLAAPEGGNGGGEGADWSHQNKSTYLDDGALWTTCRESNTVIGRLYRKWNDQAWVKQSTVYGQPQLMCVLPQQDFICITGI